MVQLYQDAMAICRSFGLPSYFITFTCNPNWPEIQAKLLPRQTATDRPDLVTRVFCMKLSVLIKDLMKDEVFGLTVAQIHVIEFQKRGLPHTHILIILKLEFRPTIPAQIDMAISAEHLDPEMDPEGMFETISKCMMHGPCGPAFPNAPCMQDGQCSKGYPRPFRNETSLDENGYPLYRCRDNGLKVLVKGVELDNRWVVPYNPYLCKKFNGHINIEASISIYGVKYLFKYIYKGHD
jgi:hypothetical protein